MSSAKPQSRQKSFRIVAAVIVVTGIGGYVCLHRGELSSVTHALYTGRWYWLVIAVAFEALFFLNEGLCFSWAFRLTGTRIAAHSVVPILLGAQTVSVIVPSEFLADQSLFFYFAERNGKSPTQVALGVLLAEMSELFSFMVVLIAGFLSLAVYSTVQPFEAAAGWIVTLLCLVLVTLTAFLLRNPSKVANSVTALQSLWNRFSSSIRPAWRLSQDWAATMNQKLLSGIAAARTNPKGLAGPLVIALAGHLIRIACLFAVIEAFGMTIALWKITTAYAIGTLVWIVSPIPGGIGLVESAYSIVFVSLGTTPVAAATLALAYRGVIFWLPLCAGIVALRFVSTPKRAITI